MQHEIYQPIFAVESLFWPHDISPYTTGINF